MISQYSKVCKHETFEPSRESYRYIFEAADIIEIEDSFFYFQPNSQIEAETSGENKLQ